MKTFQNFNTIKIKAASDKELQIKNMQKYLENKQEANEKVSKQNEELKKEMININSQLKQRKMKSPKKLRKIIILKKK